MTSTFDKPFSPEDALAHYGVKGMRWGHRKAEDPSSGSTKPTKQEKRETKARTIEARAAKHEVRIKEIQDEFKALPPGFKTAYKRNQLLTEATNHQAYVDGLRADAQRVRDGKLTSTQKTLLIGGAVVGAGLLAYGAYSMSQSGQLNSLMMRGNAFLNGGELFKKNDALAGKMTSDDVLKNVVKGLNPNYKNPGGQMNCRRCSFTYELRRRGFDVVSTPSSMGYGQSESGVINALTPGKRNKYGARSLSQGVVSREGIRSMLPKDHRLNPANLMSVKNVQDKIMGYEDFHHDRHNRFSQGVLDSLKKMPNGARGEVVFDFTRFGHSMSWEIFDGKPVIFDTQKGVKYNVDTPYDWFQLTQKWGLPRAAEMTRLDNIPLDHTFLSRWATNKK